MAITRTFLFSFSLLAAFALRAQTPDILLLNDGEKLIGRLERSNGATVTFKSDLLGELDIDWSKIKELQAGGPFVVVEKGVKLGRKTDTSKLAKGSISVAGPTLTVSGKAMPVADAAHILDEPTFEKDVHHDPRIFDAWNGSITAGATLVQATQKERSFAGSVSLVRAIPEASWLDPRNRTLIDFSAADSVVRQPNTPQVKSEIFHGAAERDQYFKGSDVYGFGGAAFDHNYSQGLDLQQNYGAGIGWTVIKQATQTLDVKASMSYVRQAFAAGQSLNLFGSTIAQNYLRRLKHGIVFKEQISATPTWSNLHATSAAGGASITAAVFKRLSFNASVADTFVNNPPVGFKKNSFLLSTGLSYALR